MSESVHRLGRNLRRIRTVHGLSSTELAGRANIARATLTAIEAGKGNPTVETLVALAGVLGVTTSELLEDDKPAALSIIRAEPTRDPRQVMRLHFLRRFPLGPCVIDLSTFELDPNVGYRHDCEIEGSLVHLVLHRGELAIETDNDKETLSPGDYGCFMVDLPCTLTAIGDVASGTLLMHYAAERAPAPPAGGQRTRPMRLPGRGASRMSP
ncbi:MULTISPECIES: helix-turn-helix domain-containing protein [Mycolicibacterium]|jgi:transcriptional regulator with XRE-family HTH domain|uniref:helix-turn-helix domain-containing protein n=1 Tax=Mycolicibacterium TaxID=1866885 RepID=UPI001CA371E6|nr:helix-turn-helix transcriptional regulator [Mycolicibacterium austroafricanum]QZT55069.1 helix-turn-helix domain-containing protein [Mycolicibacterium austroafricanum]